MVECTVCGKEIQENEACYMLEFVVLQKDDKLDHPAQEDADFICLNCANGLTHTEGG